MRIKSYFAASVQAAIAMARKEFGDAVTLVTSHVAAPDARHLGQYEVVFAIDEPEEKAPEPVQPVVETRPEPGMFSEFQQVLLQAVHVKPAPPVELPQKLEGIRVTLIDLGIDAATTAAVMTLIEKSLPVALSPAPKETAPVVSIDSRRYPSLSPAELSFISAVSDSPGAASVRSR